MLIYYSMNDVDLTHVSATFRGHLQGGIMRRKYYKDTTSNVKI
jgi:hypothetical protein